MNRLHLRITLYILGGAFLLMVAMSLVGVPKAMAQDIQEQEVEADVDFFDEDEDEEEVAAVEEIVVTGSRIRRNEFSSASPIQILKGEKSRELGLFDTGEILKSATQVSGQQIDNTFGGFVIDNGPGSSTVGLRGLEPQRTLVLINGRRVAPAGIGGAPTAPDLNLIPGIMIDRAEVLLDGASTVYGSDAISGVYNILLKKNIEGFSFDGSVQSPESGGAEELALAALWGKAADNYHVTVGAEFYDRQSQKIRDNPFFNKCEGFYYEDEQGNKYEGNRGLGPAPSDVTNCDIFPLTNRLFLPVFWGSVYYTPGYSNTGIGIGGGIPNLSESTVSNNFTEFFPHWVAADSNGDGVNDITIVDLDGDGLKDFDFQDPFYNYNLSDYNQSGDFVSQNRRLSLVLNGEYSFQDESDTVWFFDGLYAQRNSDSFSPGGQFFPEVPADNPYNICNPNGLNGVDCLGVIGFPIGPSEVQPILNIRGDRDFSDADVMQYRLVSGLKGNLIALDALGEGNWAYEAYMSYSYSKGKESLIGIHEARLFQSLDAEIDPETNTAVCKDPSNGCVALNLFAPSIYQEGGGTFTDEEAEFLFVSRNTETIVKQTVLSGFVAGDLTRLPWNNSLVPLVVGYEFRRDVIISNPNDVAAEGLLAYFYADEGADGGRNLNEIFAETELSLLSGQPFAEELNLSLSTRWTNESFYDPATTYALKSQYRPNEWLTFRGTYGTSYRAPDLRERFLNGTTGFLTVYDPCVVPDAAKDGNPLDPTAPSIYNPDNDTRLDYVLASCIASGVDPTSLGIDPSLFSSYSVEIVTGGASDLKEENSTAYTYGIVFEQPWIDQFDLRFAATYYSIEITDSVSEPSASFIISDCYSDPSQPNATSDFCSRISRGGDGSLSLIDSSFINIGLITSTGVDLNMAYEQNLVIDAKELAVSLDLRATYTEENIFQVIDSIDDDAGEPANPDWRVQADLSLEYDDFSFNWRASWIQGGKDDNPEDFDPDGIPCDGLVDVSCRPVYYTTSYINHTMSLFWSNDTYRVGFGVQNVFNESPPKVDAAGVFSINNIPLGVGYDVFGRSAYLNFGADF